MVIERGAMEMKGNGWVGMEGKKREDDEGIQV
jgi:hypothetical protein